MKYSSFSVRLFCVVLLCAVVQSVKADYAIQHTATQLIYCDETHHLKYLLDTEKKTASIGDGIGEKNALLYPPIGDPYWTSFEPVDWWDDIVIPSSVTWQGVSYTVTSVAYQAFYKCLDAKKVTLPETIKTIGGYAFRQCIYLQGINLHEGIESIGSSAFYDCRLFKEIKLPSTLKHIETGTFVNCRLVESLTIPAGCTKVSQDAFTYMIGLKTLIFEDSDTPIELSGSYELGPGYNQSDYPRLKQAAYRGQFNDSPLKYIYVGREINVPELLFNEYSPFEWVYQRYLADNRIFTDHSSQKQVEVVEFGDKVKNISNNLFNGTYIYKDVTLPAYVETIGEKAFYKSLNNRRLVIPATCREIGESAFSTLNTGTLKEVVCNALVPPATTYPSLGADVLTVPAGKRADYKSHPYWGIFFICDPADELVEVDVKYAGQLYGRLAFQDVEPQDVFRLKIKGKLGDDDLSVIKEMTQLYELDLSGVSLEDITPIKDVAKYLKKMELPYNVKEIPGAFFSNSFLTGTITIPETCTMVGSSAFYRTLVDKVVVAGSTTIGRSAFGYCNALSEVLINGDNVRIEENAFSECSLNVVRIGNGAVVESHAFSPINSLIIDGDVESVADNGFAYLSKITFNGRIKEYTPKAFDIKSTTFGNVDKNGILNIVNMEAWLSMSHDVPMLEFFDKKCINDVEPQEMTIPSGITEIPSSSFMGFTSLVKVNLPKDVETIGSNAFRGCTALQTINTQNVKSLGMGTFSDCSSLQDIKFNENTEVIFDSLFYGCRALQGVSIPLNVKRIGKSAFEGCTSMANIKMPAGVESIGESAFKGCESITSLDVPFGLTSMGKSAFEDCVNLKNLKSKQINPITIDPTTFSNISKKGFLLVPIGTVESYYDNGWGRIPLIDEADYVVVVSASKGGSVSHGEQSITGTDAFWATPEEDFDLNIAPSEYYYAKYCVENGTKRKLGFNELSIQYPEVTENNEVEVLFAKYALGDVNDDNYIDVSDITSIVRYIQETPLDNFVPAAADVNTDRYIDVGDITGTVNLIHEFADDRLKSRSVVSESLTCNFYAEVIFYDVAKQEYTLAVSMDNNQDVSGIQVEFTVPDGYTIPVDEQGNLAVSFNKSRMSGMNITSVTKLQGGRYQVLCTSTTPTVISSSKGQLFTITLGMSEETTRGENSDIEISDIRVSTPNAEVVRVAPCRISVTSEPTAVNELEVGTFSADGKFSENGTTVIYRNGKKYSISGVEFK